MISRSFVHDGPTRVLDPYLRDRHGCVIALSTMAAEDPVDPAAPALTEQQKKAQMLADEDPLLISQSLTYVTDDGSVLHSFQSAPYSTGKRIGRQSLLFTCFAHILQDLRFSSFSWRLSLSSS